MAEFLDLLKEALAHDPSDIHITSGHPVILEINGEMRRLTDHALEWVEFESVARLLRDIMRPSEAESSRASVAAPSREDLLRTWLGK